VERASRRVHRTTPPPMETVPFPRRSSVAAPRRSGHRRAMTFLIYGANGYSGALIAEEAVRRGHRPVLAGRALGKVRPIADRHGLSARAFSLDDAADARRGLEGVELVVHAAGPFVFTSATMIEACLDVGASYADITGEIPVFARTFSYDARARERSVCLM